MEHAAKWDRTYLYLRSRSPTRFSMVLEPYSEKKISTAIVWAESVPLFLLILSIRNEHRRRDPQLLVPSWLTFSCSLSISIDNRNPRMLDNKYTVGQMGGNDGTTSCRSSLTYLGTSSTCCTGYTVSHRLLVSGTSTNYLLARTTVL